MAEKFDHCAIYLLIAGTYTPFLLVGLDSPLAKGLMAVIWGLALLGVLFKLAFAHRFEALSLVTYLTMGWLSLIVIYQLVTRLEAGGVTLLAIGGVVYTWGDFLRLQAHPLWPRHLARLRARRQRLPFHGDLPVRLSVAATSECVLNRRLFCFKKRRLLLSGIQQARSFISEPAYSFS